MPSSLRVYKPLIAVNISANFKSLFLFADIDVGFEDSSYTFSEGSTDAAVNIIIQSNIEHDADFFNPPLSDDVFILVYSHDATAEGEEPIWSHCSTLGQDEESLWACLYARGEGFHLYYTHKSHSF